MSFNYIEKSAKNRTLKYIEQLLKKYDNYRTSAAAKDISSLPNNAKAHVKSELSRVVDSHKNFRDYIGDDSYSHIIYRNFERSKNKSELERMARLGVYDVSHIPAYTSQSLADFGPPSIRATANNVPGKVPFMSRLLGSSKFLNRARIVPRYRTQATNKAYSPEQLQEIRSLNRKGGWLTEHADNPMYEVVLNSKGAHSPKLMHDLYGVSNPYGIGKMDRIAGALRKRFGDDNVHTIDSLVESIHPSKLYHGGSAASSIPGSKGYDGRRMVETVDDIMDPNMGPYEHRLNVLADKLKNTPPPIKNKIIEKLVRNLLANGSINLMRGWARRADRIAKGKSWFSPLPHVGMSYANFNSPMFSPSEVFVPKNVMNSIIRDGARHVNSNEDRAMYFNWLLNDIDLRR